MTNPELAAAANRLLTEKHYNYWECNWKVSAMEDSALLAKHYIAQHDAEDDLPVTEEWLRSIGAKEEYEYRHDGQDVYGLYLGPAKWFNFANGSEFLIDHREGYVIKTRRAVKQLLQALGITTKGTGHE